MEIGVIPCMIGDLIFSHPLVPIADVFKPWLCEIGGCFFVHTVWLVADTVDCTERWSLCTNASA